MIPPDILLVIPSYRDGGKLAAYLPALCAALAARDGPTMVQVVDDGSPVAEQEALAGAIQQLRFQHRLLQPLIANPANRGKGQAIRTGWAAAPGAWLAFVDADGAVPATEVAALLERARHSPAPAVFIADRTQPGVKLVRRFWYRRLGSRLFNAWVRLWLGLNLTDTQCGLKVIPATLFRSFAWREDGFAFDLELLLRARTVGLPVVRHAVSWTEKSGSTLGVSAMVTLFAAAYRLRNLPPPPATIIRRGG